LKSNSLKSSFEIRIFANSLLKKVTGNKSIEDVLAVVGLKIKLKEQFYQKPAKTR